MSNSNQSSANNTTAGTMSLLNDTYQVPDIKNATEAADNMRKITPAFLFSNEENAKSPDAPKKINPTVFKSPRKSPMKFLSSSGGTLFRSPITSNALSPQPENYVQSKATELFKSPLRD